MMLITYWYLYNLVWDDKKGTGYTYDSNSGHAYYIYRHMHVFLCDPSHQIKAMAKDVFSLALSSKSNSDCEKIDALHFKKYISYYVGKNKLLPFNPFTTNKNQQLSIYSVVVNSLIRNGVLIKT